MELHEMRNGARKSPCNETRPCPYTKQEENKKRGGYGILSLFSGWTKKEKEEKKKKKRELSEGG